jgi:hypothetical protein
MRRLASVVLAAALAAASLAACGGGGEKSSSTGASAPTTSTSPELTDKTSTTKPPAVHTPETPTSPENQPGGAGDETPAHFDATFTGRGGRIAPSQVSVGPFISVRVILKSADGQRYALSVSGKTLEAGGGGDDTARLTLSGLRPGQSYTLRQPAGGKSIRVVANAEPGP